jgi:GNAT superfamily N-acetyltransferase
MNEPELFLTDSPDGEACRLIDEGLGDFNAQHAGYWDSRPLAVLVRDPASRQIVGGMLCRTSLGLLFIDLVFLPEELRGHQIGTRMLRMAEEEAARRGCRGAVLYTISFQAPGICERRGWREFGRIPCEPPGTSRVLMAKDTERRQFQIGVDLAKPVDGFVRLFHPPSHGVGQAASRRLNRARHHRERAEQFRANADATDRRAARDLYLRLAKTEETLAKAQAPYEL